MRPLDQIISQSENCYLYECKNGHVMINVKAVIHVGDKIAYILYGIITIGKYLSEAIITEEGEVVEGAALEEVDVIGKVIYEILSMHEYNRPVI